jgi:hypothetical protein
MAKKAPVLGPSLFDVIDRQIRAERPKTTPDNCPEHEWKKTLTIWTGEYEERLTWTCVWCDLIRGRFS